MECYICSDKTGESIISTKCRCVDMAVHLSCIKEFKRRNPNKNILKCTVCNHEFHGRLRHKLKERRIVQTEAEVVNVMVSNKKNRTKIILTLYFILALSFGIGMSYFLINNYYTKPKEIKDNQIATICNITDITYAYNRKYIQNDTIVTEYKITKAKGEVDNIKNVDMLFLVKHLRYDVCPINILTECVVYIKNDKLIYLAHYKDSIESRFISGSYGIFIPLFVAVSVFSTFAILIRFG